MRIESKQIRADVVVLCLVQFVDVLGVTVVVTALPSMLSGLQAPPADAGFVSTGYAMCFGGLLLFGARLGDRYGHRLTLLASLAVFSIGSAAAATAPTVLLLTAACGSEGAAAAVSVPSALRLLIGVTAAGPSRRSAVAGWSAAGAAAGASGFIAGGAISDLLGWRAIFWACVPVGIALIILVRRVIPPDAHGRDAMPLSHLSATLFTVAAMTVIAGTTLLGQPAHRVDGVVVVAAGLGLGVVFVRRGPRSAAPLLPREALRLAPLRRGAAAAFLNTASTSSTMTLATLYLQDVVHLGSLLAAIELVPFSIGAVAGSTLAPRCLRRISSSSTVGAGLGLIAAADTALAAGVDVPIALAAAGIGVGVSSAAATTLGTNVPDQRKALAAGVVNTSAQLGTALGIPIVLLAAEATTSPAAGRPVGGWMTAAAIAAGGTAWATWKAGRDYFRGDNPSSPQSLLGVAPPPSGPTMPMR